MIIRPSLLPSAHQWTTPTERLWELLDKSIASLVHLAYFFTIAFFSSDVFRCLVTLRPFRRWRVPAPNLKAADWHAQSAADRICAKLIYVDDMWFQLVISLPFLFMTGHDPLFFHPFFCLDSPVRSSH